MVGLKVLQFSNCLLKVFAKNWFYPPAKYTPQKINAANWTLAKHAINVVSVHYSSAWTHDCFVPLASDHNLSLNWEHLKIIRKLSIKITQGNYPLCPSVHFLPEAIGLRIMLLYTILPNQLPESPMCTNSPRWLQETFTICEKQYLISQCDWWWNRSNKWW